MDGFDDTDMPDAGDESDVSSVFDVETPALDQLRTYTAVYPPQLPDYTFLDGQEYETRWIEDSWRYTARAYNEWDGSGFEVRQMNIHKFGDLELAEPDDPDYWTPKYAMGPPTQDKDWHALFEKWGFPVLEKAGFLNYYPPAQDRDMGPIGQLADARNPQKEDKKRIHPVLRREIWRDIEDDEWQLLRPALLLASAMLDDPATLTFLYAITDTASTTEFVDTLHGKCKVAYIPTALTDIEQSAVYSKVLAMRNWMTWRFVPQRDMVAKDADGITNWRFDANGNCVGAAHSDTSQSIISLSQAYLDVLQRYDDDRTNGIDDHGEHLTAWMDKYNVPDHRRPNILDSTSAFDRTTFKLANTIVHEFSHAYTGAYFRLPDKNVPIEPWIQGHRSNEMGNAFTNYLLGGCVQPMPRYEESSLATHRQACNVVFGLYFDKFWDLWTKNDDPEKVMTAGTANALAGTQTHYPVPQKYVHNMHTEETWRHQVPRFGLAAIRLPRLEDWAITQTKTP